MRDGFAQFSKKQQEAMNYLTDAVIYESRSSIIGSVEIVEDYVTVPLSTTFQ